MTIKKLLLALSAALAGAAFAQAPLGTVTNVQGVVTATQGATGVTVAPGQAIVNGTRLVTTSNATATLRLNSGCTLTIPPGHAVTVMQTMTCQQLAAAVQPIVPVASPPAFPPAPALVNGLIVATGAIVATQAARVIIDEDDEPLSPR